MTDSWNWPGSRWWRIDLHAHSPASHDFRPRGAHDWLGWVAAAKAAGLDAVVVTDHNTAAGIGPLRAAAAEVPDAPILFPGVELTANDGSHLLLVLDPASGEAHVDDLLSFAQIPVDERGRPEARSPLSVEKLFELTRARGAVILAAHVNGPAGLLAHEGAQRLRELASPYLAGVEVDPSHDLDEGWLDGTKNGSRPLPKVWGSDAHTNAELGRRFTWMKMTVPNLEGLRLALLDGNQSLRPPDVTFDPNRHAECVIEEVRVSSAKYLGRAAESDPSKALLVPFNPWLNAIIGGRGTGKSTLVDLIRQTLRREGELGEPVGDSLRSSFDRRMKVPARRGEEGLLTPHTRVDVIYRKDGDRFRLSWDLQGKATPIARLRGGVATPEEGDIRERFPIRIYSQKQLFTLAKRPNSLLGVIDDNDQVRASDLARQRREAEARYLSLRAEARALRTQAADLPSREAALADVRRKLDVLQQGGHADALASYRVRRRLDGTWNSIRASVDEGLDVIDRASEALVVADLGIVNGETEGEAALRRVHAHAAEVVKELQQTVREAVGLARKRLADTQAGPDAMAWKAALAESEQAYQEVTTRLAGAGIANPDEYRDLLLRTTYLEKEILALGQKRAEADARDQEATAALSRYRALRTELSQRRRLFAEKASGDLVRVAIRTFEDRAELEPFLRETLAIAGFERDYEGLCQEIDPGEGWEFGRLDSLVAQLRALLDDPRAQWPGKDARFARALRKLQPERLDRLALYDPDDSVEVSFRDTKQGGAGWRDLQLGSPGQQTAALLAFLLGFGTEPIILDQPEDDLDTKLIYELLVRRLRETKPTRQIIVVTHNPNIVVHGDAELLLSMGPSKLYPGESELVFRGGLQEKRARDEVCIVMEGGEEAFKDRYRRIIETGVARNG